MNPSLWARALVGLLALNAAFFLGGWWAGRKVDHLHEAIENLRAAQDHRRCEAIIDRLSSYLLWQEGRIDVLEQDPARLADEVEEFLAEGGQAS